MDRSKLLTIAVIGLLLLNLGTLGFIFIHRPGMPPEHRRPPGREEPRQIIIERLNFDAAQQKKYEELIDVHRKMTHELNEKGRELHDELFALLAEEGDQNNKAEEIITQIAANQKAMDQLNYSHFRDIRSICNPDQIKDFKVLAHELAVLFSPKGPPPPPMH